MITKRKNIVALYNAIQELNKIKVNVKFAYGIAKNSKLIASEIEVIQEVETKTVNIIKPFNEAKFELAKKYGQQVKQGEYYVSKDDVNYAQFEKELKNLQKEHEAEIVEFEEYQVQLKVLYDETVELSLHAIAMESLPEDGITPEQIGVLMECGIVE